MLYRCYAKVNLTLEVLGRRPDGYHELSSLVHTISLADDLYIEPHPEVHTRVEGLDLTDETNLVARAANLLAETYGVRLGAELTLVKNIPAAAGLGGGSSDAATTLVGLNRLWQTELDTRRLRQLAGQLGSDVPFFVRGGAALMRGRGDRLTRLSAIEGQWLILLVPPMLVPQKTERLYGALSEADFTSGEVTARAVARVSQGQALDIDDLTNAFERAARETFDGLDDVWSTAERIAGRRFMLSGAGPALFAFAADRADGLRQAALLSSAGADVQVLHTVRHARIGYP